ncbi:hypothetical protein CQ13_00040 [Bradyrhizobium retamae]|uniref:Uncharacterized protein n=1 Tax=Bradyrhizobium retamae TaxID=1300035 RepID=A0A0R3NCQ7_9BRAD|nr:hypothetical protein CQ13_00040 [Bradyrhizobium retamae]
MPPLAATGVTEQACGGEQETAPAPHPQRGLSAINLAKHALEFVGEPASSGSGTRSAVPTIAETKLMTTPSLFGTILFKRPVPAMG